jgi:hypothetical protein
MAPDLTFALEYRQGFAQFRARDAQQLAEFAFRRQSLVQGRGALREESPYPG